MINEAFQSAGQDRYLVVVADDFGRSASVNRAVAMACDAGLLTAASLMAGGSAFEEAVGLAGKYPGLSVGLHVTLSGECPVLPPADIPDLVNDNGLFDKNPMRAGITYWRSKDKIASQIEAEVKAQFDKLEGMGIQPTHVDCHHHLHMHPLLFAVIAREAVRRNVAWIRIPLEPWSFVFGLHLQTLDMKAVFMRLLFGLIAIRNLRMAGECGLRVMNNVYGLSGTGRMNEEYLLALLPYVKGMVSEIYLHPDLDSSPGREEMKAATSERVIDRLKAFGIRLVGFRELTALLSPHTGSAADPVKYNHG
ncbi:MAG TPA: ChbG/HpnK family deacetylase [Syntrophorhabdaceae bacterium]|nr:ChbG/HpnK family deacetylase [Syntrophorhabdaceae bacterium]HQM80367.1 ChbG/HpnK family deacetylase [Syntrophorhabdaceae bacterium]